MPFFTYSVLRLVILAASFGVLYLVGLRGWLWAVVSVIVAFAISYLTLRPVRDKATAYLAERREQRVVTSPQNIHDAEAGIEDEVIERAAESGAEDEGDGPQHGEGQLK